jgi:hypothetical protein
MVLRSLAEGVGSGGGLYFVTRRQAFQITRQMKTYFWICGLVFLRYISRLVWMLDVRPLAAAGVLV